MYHVIDFKKKKKKKKWGQMEKFWKTLIFRDETVAYSVIFMSKIFPS